MTKKEMMETITKKFNECKANKFTASKTELDTIKTANIKLTAKELENIIATLDAVEKRNLERLAKKATATAPTPEKKAPKKDKVASAKAPETKKEEAPQWEMPEELKTFNTDFTAVEATPENIEAFINGDLVIGWHIEKTWFNMKTRDLYDNIMSDEFNKAVINKFPFDNNIEMVRAVASNDFTIVTQSMNTECFNRLSKDAMMENIKSGEMAIYKVKEEAPKKKAVKRTKRNN